MDQEAEMTKDRSLDSVYVPLKVAFGIVPLVAGLDKFTNLLTSGRGT
jgi:hypothetical protein